MALVITKDNKIRFADVGDKLKDGERQLFYKQGRNGGLIFKKGPKKIERKPQRKV